jgi:hypothetical protein
MSVTRRSATRTFIQRNSMAATNRARVQEDLRDGFTTFKLRCAGRYDMVVPEVLALNFMQDDRAPWMPLVRTILGRGAPGRYTCMRPECQSGHSNQQLTFSRWVTRGRCGPHTRRLHALPAGLRQAELAHGRRSQQ